MGPYVTGLPLNVYICSEPIYRSRSKLIYRSHSEPMLTCSIKLYAKQSLLLCFYKKVIGMIMYYQHDTLIHSNAGGIA